MEQLKIFFDALSSEGIDQMPHLVVGDFNSLSSASDYSRAKYQEMCDMRSRNGWERPQFTVYQHMLKMGYRDCWKEGGGSLDCATCWANTRIDYVFASKDFPMKATCARINVKKASDHQMVVIEFKTEM